MIGLVWHLISHLSSFTWDYLGCVNIQDFALYESIAASPCLHCHRRDVDLCLSPADKSNPIGLSFKQPKGARTGFQIIWVYSKVSDNRSQLAIIYQQLST